jgi:hypothetical protein
MPVGAPFAAAPLREERIADLGVAPKPMRFRSLFQRRVSGRRGPRHLIPFLEE